MSFNIRIPNITANSTAEQIRQVHSYLFQVVEQLNWALSAIEKDIKEGAVNESVHISSPDILTEKETATTFNSIKSLIIKSADIIEAYYKEFNKRFEGEYVAQSDFGTYREETASEISVNSTNVEQMYESLQQIITDVGSIEHTLIDVNAHIKSGLLCYDDDGAPVYGLEIGQRNKIDGVETFNKFARFTSDKLAFYDSNDNEVAYISDKKLYITHVEVTASFKLGGLMDTVLADGSVVTKYLAYGGNG